MLATAKLLPALLILLIARNGISELVRSLPGAPAYNFNQYSGYYAVSEMKNHFLHYWFMESQNNPATDPVLLWLTGGPGCSSLDAAFTEWGPLMINPDGATLSWNPYAWNRNASVLALESPVGVGYSYVTSGTELTGDNKTAVENWEALVAFFQEFTQYATNDFYVTGESYGGIYVPTLVQTILDRQNQFKINIKGFAIGNGCVSKNLGMDTVIPYMYTHGFIDETSWQKVKKECCNNNVDDCQFHKYFEDSIGYCGEFVDAVTVQQWYGGINPYNIYDNCTRLLDSDGAKQKLYKRFKGDKKPYPSIDSLGLPCLDESAPTTYFNRQDVRKAMFIPTSLGKWASCNNEIGVLYRQEFTDMTSRVKNAVNAGLKVMLYHGDIDTVCNAMLGEKFLNRLGYPVSQSKKVYKVDTQVGGFYTKYGDKIYMVTVRDAGHMVPTDQPATAFYILDHFLNDQPF